MLICTICSLEFWPTGRWHTDWCAECHGINFSESQELRLHAPDPSVQALTRRQLTRMAQQHAHWEGEAQRRLEDAS